MQDSCLILKKLVKDIHSVDGILAYSLFQLPGEQIEREKILHSLVSSGKAFHFAVENMIVHDYETLEKSEKLWRIKRMENFFPRSV